VYQSEDEIYHLQNLMDHSMDRAGEFLRFSLQIPGKSLNARQLIRRLTGPLTVSFATVSSTGMPRVAPVLAFFNRGAFSIPTVRNALRARHLRMNANVSLTHYEGNDFAVIVHGTGELIGESDPEFHALVRLQLETVNEDVRDWGDAVYIRINPTHFYTFARYPEQFPE
jgi:hypothetical protein